jgi:TonB family protein
LLLGVPAANLFAQTAPPADDQPSSPFQVTTRIFQARAARGVEEPTDQLFSLRVANPSDEGRWLQALRKVYPGFEIALLQTHARRVFKSSKPTQIEIGSSDRRQLLILLNGANSVGDGKKPGTSLVAEVHLSFEKGPPLAFSLQSIEAADGVTYFFAIPRLRINPDDYHRFMRPGVPATALVPADTFLIFALSVELGQPYRPPRLLNDQEAEQLRQTAVKKVEPAVPPSLSRPGLGGYVRVLIEVGPEGQVGHASTISSTFPEMNEAVIAAVRQWSFARSFFASDQRPLTSVLTFNFPAPAAPKE